MRRDAKFEERLFDGGKFRRVHQQVDIGQFDAGGRGGGCATQQVHFFGFAAEFGGSFCTSLGSLRRMRTLSAAEMRLLRGAMPGLSSLQRKGNDNAEAPIRPMNSRLFMVQMVQVP